MVGFPLAGWRVGLDYQSYSPTFFQMKNRLGRFFYWLANCQVALFASVALLPFSTNKKRPRESPYWRAGFRSSAPVGSGPNGNRVALVFLFLFMGSMKHGLEPESLQTHFFSLLIIALLDLGGICFLLSCCVLHFLGFFES